MSSRDRIILFVAEGFGLGRIRFAPGTWGSLWGLPLGWSLGYFHASLWSRLAVAAAMFVIGVPLCNRAAKLRDTKDPGSVVWDEIAAFPLVYAFVPRDGHQQWIVLVLGFILFRIFDIWKPPPVRQCDKLGGGFGIMIDDTVAACYAAVFLHLLTRVM
jgi:phosphatidylglycerophosphatase A